MSQHYIPIREEWLAARQEEILDPGQRIVDPHHHLWERPGWRYRLDDILADIRTGHDVRATVLVQVEGWTKVRDAEGTIAWIDRNALAARRTLVVTAPMADVRQSASAESPLVFQAEKWVILELLEAAPMGWAKVKHRDGASGYVRITQVWGL